MENDVTQKIDTIDYNTKFLIIKATRKQSGLYKIVAKNSVGQDEAELDITILGLFINFVNPDLFCLNLKVRYYFNIFYCVM